MTDREHFQARWLSGVVPMLPLCGIVCVSLLSFAPAYLADPARRDLWRAAHSHAGVVAVLALAALLFSEQAGLTRGIRRALRGLVPLGALALPAGIAACRLWPGLVQPGGLVFLAWAGAALFAAGLCLLGIGLMRVREEKGGREP